MSLSFKQMKDEKTVIVKHPVIIKKKGYDFMK